jgi:hypothetical protein
MVTTKSIISGWFDHGVEKQATHMIVVCDTFDYDDYPVYVMKEQNVYDVIDKYSDSPQQRVMEVYNLLLDKSSQMNEARAFHPEYIEVQPEKKLPTIGNASDYLF